jgi:hypothetical protein
MLTLKFCHRYVLRQLDYMLEVKIYGAHSEVSSSQIHSLRRANLANIQISHFAYNLNVLSAQLTIVLLEKLAVVRRQKGHLQPRVKEGTSTFLFQPAIVQISTKPYEIIA